MPDPTPILTESGLFELLQLEEDAEHLTHLIQRRNLPAITFKRDGRVTRRFLREDVLDWLRAESGKKNGRPAEPAGGRARRDRARHL